MYMMYRHELLGLLISSCLLTNCGGDGTPDFLGKPIGAMLTEETLEVANRDPATMSVGRDNSRSAFGKGDANSGIAALASVQSALDSAKPGDVIQLGNLTKPESLHMKISGTKDKPIVIRSLAHQATIQDILVDADYITIAGLNIHGPDSCGDTSESASSGRGILYRGQGGVIIDNDIDETCREGIEVGRAAESDSAIDMLILGNRIKHAVQAGILLYGRGHVASNNEVLHTRQRNRESDTLQGDADGIRFFGKEHTIAGNKIVAADYDGTKVQTAHIDCFQSWGPAESVVIDGNICEAFSDSGNQAEHAKGIQLSEEKGSIKDIIIRNNIIFGFRGITTSEMRGSGRIYLVYNLFSGDLRPFEGPNWPMAIDLGERTKAHVAGNILYNHRRSINAPKAQVEGGTNLIYQTDDIESDEDKRPEDLWSVKPNFENFDASNFKTRIDATIDIPTSDAIALEISPSDIEGTLRPTTDVQHFGPYIP